MADNVTTQSATLASVAAGEVFAFDDIAGVKVARSKTGFGADGTYGDVHSGNPLPVVQTGTPTLPTGASTLAEQQTQTTAIGATNETAPASDTATAGLNGRLQRIAQRLTSLIALLPTSLGQKTKANSLAVTLASDEDTLPVSLASVPSHAVTNAGTFAVQAAQSGTWTVQPGNTANTTAWKVDGSAVTQPVSLASLPALAAGTNGIGKLTANSGVDIGDVDVTSTVLPTANTTSAVTSVADTASSTTLLSASGSRKGFRITNTSSAVLYVKYGTTASASDFTARLPQWAYLEENFYSGRVDGIWASDPGDGAALITSLSA